MCEDQDINLDVEANYLGNKEVFGIITLEICQDTRLAPTRNTTYLMSKEV